MINSLSTSHQFKYIQSVYLIFMANKTPLQSVLGDQQQTWSVLPTSEEHGQRVPQNIGRTRERTTCGSSIQLPKKKFLVGAMVILALLVGYYLGAAKEEEKWERKEQSQKLKRKWDKQMRQGLRQSLNRTNRYQDSQLHTLDMKNFSCKADDFAGWHSGMPGAYETRYGLRIEKVPYKGLNLIQNAGSLSPLEHFSQLVAFFKQRPIDQTIFVHSGSVYAVIVLAAISSTKVKIVVSSEYQDAYALHTNFVMNNIKDKVVMGSEIDERANIEKAGVIVTEESEFARRYYTTKQVMLVVSEGTVTNPSLDETFMIAEQKKCVLAKLQLTARKILGKGVYLNKKFRNV